MKLTDTKLSSHAAVQGTSVMSLWIWKSGGRKKGDYYLVGLSWLVLPFLGAAAAVTISLLTASPRLGVALVMALAVIGLLIVVGRTR
jgi:uncharacterized membrane protein YdcZ (DUF606 family)